MPGSSGRTWAASRALSSRTRTRRPSSTERYRAARSSSESGIAESAVPRARRNAPRTVSGSAACVPAPWRSMYNCPSGKADRVWWATWTARVVLPTPPIPARADTAITRPCSEDADDADDRTLLSSDTKAARPVKSGTVAGSWAGRTRAGAGSGASGAEGSASPGSAWRMRCCNSLRPGRGSTPSSSARRRRVSAYTARASACLPLRYSASISSSRSRSRRGCSAVRAVNSLTDSAWQPCSRSMSRRDSRSWRSHSSNRARWASAYGPGTPASGLPSHSSSARLRTSRAWERSPALLDFSASEASSCATVRSSAPSARERIAYPPDSLTSTQAPSTFRSRDAYVRTAASACDGGSSPHSASISSAAVAVRPSRNNSAASSARCCGDPVGRGASSRQARTGPSTPKRSVIGESAVESVGDSTGKSLGSRCRRHSRYSRCVTHHSSLQNIKTRTSVCLVSGVCVSCRDSDHRLVQEVLRGSHTVSTQGSTERGA